MIADAAIVARASEIANHGVGHYDALHLASAVAGGAELFVTTDDKLLKRARLLDVLPIMLPGEALAAMENWYED